MSAPVDVLAVMRSLTDLALNSGGRRGEDEEDNEPAINLYEDAIKAHSAVAKLIAAARGAERDAAILGMTTTRLTAALAACTREKQP